MAIVGQFSHTEIVRLIRFYEKAERELLNRVNRALLRGNNIEYLKQMKQAVDAILQSLREGNRTWCLEAIPRVYLDGVRYADGLLKEARVEITTSFGAVHQSAAQVLAENVYQRLEDVTQVIGRQVNDIYRQLALENIRGSTIGYDTWKQVAQQIRQQIAERGITGFIDRQGRRWNLSSYTAMVARTSTMEAHLEGTRNRLLEQGHDLIVVSDHRGECELCRPWEGRVLSLSGRTPHYPTLAEAKAAGLFHPNCRHAYSLYLDLDLEKETGEETGEEDTKQRVYLALSSRGLSPQSAREVGDAISWLPSHERERWIEILQIANYEMLSPDMRSQPSYYWNGKIYLNPEHGLETIIHEAAHAFDLSGKFRRTVTDHAGFTLDVDTVSKFIEMTYSRKDRAADFINFARLINAELKDEDTDYVWFADTESPHVLYVKYGKWAKYHCQEVLGGGPYDAPGFLSVSDILSGLTEDQILASIAWGGHKKDYWLQSVTGKRALMEHVEAWADFCVLKVFRYVDALELLKQVVPNKYRVLEQAYREVFGEPIS